MWPAQNEFADGRIRVRGEYKCLVEAALALLEGVVPAKCPGGETTAIYQCSRPRQVFAATLLLILLSGEVLALAAASVAIVDAATGISSIGV
jgi:hypothetical protein